MVSGSKIGTSYSSINGLRLKNGYAICWKPLKTRYFDKMLMLEYYKFYYTNLTN